LSGHEDCDGDPSNGCEVSATNSDILNCGTCGKVCTQGPHILTSCDRGKCTVKCEQGMANCDATLEDGCETSLSTDLENCGGCGIACAQGAHLNTGCDQGKCSYECDQGFDSCDRTLDDGCEANLTTDLANCGGCGIECP